MKLFMCSATKTLVLILFDENHEIDSVYHMGHNDHSKTLMRFLDDLLKRNNTTIQEIDEIIVSNGPGSYTGVRIAVVVAKTLACFNKIKLSKVKTLETVASNYEGIVAPFISARNGYVFGSVYDVKDKTIVQIEPDKFMKVEDFKQIVEKHNAIEVSEENLKVNVYKLNKKDADVYKLSPEYLREWSE